MKLIKIIKLNLQGKEYCPKCLNILTFEEKKKLDAGYNITCSNCGCYIENIYL